MKQTLSPTADGNYKQIPYDPRPHYDASATTDFEYYTTDTYIFANPTRSGHITNVRISFYGYSNPSNNGHQKGKTAIYLSGQGVLYGSEALLRRDYHTTDYALNPWTGVAWTWDELDALEAGFALIGGGESRPYASGSTSEIIVTSISSGGQHRIIGMMR